jgi:hypothetical protein
MGGPDDKRYFTSDTGYGHLFVSSKEAFETKEDAISEAKKLAYKKRKSLLLQAEKFGPEWMPKIVGEK